MSDFLVSSALNCDEQFARILSAVTRVGETAVRRLRGAWGSLVISPNRYHGFQEHEDEHAIAVVVGGPLLRVPAVSSPRNSHASRHTRAVLERIFHSNAYDWHSDLLGPFCFLHVDKLSGHLTVVTDNMSFIPVYRATAEDTDGTVKTVFSTHPDAAALAAGPLRFDPVSVCDFMLHKKVTFPHTLYPNVEELAPASVHAFADDRHQETPYWRPEDKARDYHTISDAARGAREALVDVIHRAAEEYGRLCFFLSAGEDSRTLVCMAPADVDVHCITVAPSKNREARIAESVARAVHASWEFLEQPPANYLTNLGDRAVFSGSNGLSVHAHMFGVMNESSLAEQPAVIGGFSADAFLKGHFYKLSHAIPGLAYQRFISNRDNIDVVRTALVDDDILDMVASRRRTHENRLREFRSTTINEWMACWPMSQDHEIVNLWSNRRLFNSLEACMCPNLLEIAASLPANWIANRRLFQKMAAPYLRRVWWIPHGDGHFPSLPWYLNVGLRPVVRGGIRVSQLRSRSECPFAWPTQTSLVASPAFRQLIQQQTGDRDSSDSIYRHAIRIAQSEAAHPLQRFAAAQVLASNSTLVSLANVQ